MPLREVIRCRVASARCLESRRGLSEEEEQVGACCVATLQLRFYFVDHGARFRYIGGSCLERAREIEVGLCVNPIVYAHMGFGLLERFPARNAGQICSVIK